MKLILCNQCNIAFIFVFIQRSKQEKTFILIIRKLLIDMHNLRMELKTHVNYDEIRYTTATVYLQPK